jgi:hypothetical protein
MAQAARLRVADVHAIYRLIGECRDFGDDPIAWRQHLLAGLARLTGADAANNYEGQWEPYRPIGIVHWGLENGFDPQAVQRVDQAFAQEGLSFNPMFRPFMTALAQNVGPSLTRADLVSDAVWYRCPYFQDYHAEAGADAMLYCSLPLPGRSGQTSGLSLVRLLGEHDFSPRQRQIVQEAHAAVITLIGGPLARIDEPSRPRCRRGCARYCAACWMAMRTNRSRSGSG